MVTFNIKNIVFDAPAKSFVKGIKQCNAKYGCDKCTMKSIYVSGSATYQYTKFEKITDVSFRSQINKDHHNTISVILFSFTCRSAT